MPQLKIIEISTSPPPSPNRSAPEPQKSSILPLVIGILSTATTAALTASHLLRKDRALFLITMVLSSRAAQAAYKLNPTDRAKLAGAFGVFGVSALTNGKTLTKAALAGGGVVVLLEQLYPSAENFSLRKTAETCAIVGVEFFAAVTGAWLIQPQLEVDPIITGMIAGHEIYKLLSEKN